MSGESRSDLILTGTQAECLAVLRNPGHSQSKIAIEAKRSMTQTEVALHRLVELGLARQTASKLWVATPRGETCSFETISDRPYRQSRPPGPGAERLLDLLDRPMHGRAIARELGISREGVRQLLVRLHAQGRVAFGDPDHPSWLVKRADDESPVLSRDEERVLSALAPGHATDAKGLGVAARLPECEVEPIVESLVVAGLAEAQEGLRGSRTFRITAAGSEHPQYVRSRRRAPPQRLPVQSDRVRKVLQEISDAGALRIKDVKDLTQLPHQSVNALMQYLKRKQLVAKAGLEALAPYSLTEQGRAVLAEMTLRRAA